MTQVAGRVKPPIPVEDDLDLTPFYGLRDMRESEIPPKYRGWWRITGTSTWGSDDIDIVGTALISFTGRDDRLRMFVLLARVQAMATKSGVSFMWQGAWEYDQMSGTGSVKLRKDGRIIEDPPSYRDKWRRRW